MPIKKRTSAPSTISDEQPRKLEIVAKPKTPIPPKGFLRLMEEASPRVLRRLGAVAISAGAPTADADITIEDRVALLRTPHDSANPQEQRYRNRIRNRGTAITAMCIVCQGGRKAVTECVDTTCPLWAFRFGSDPFYGKSKR